MEKVRCSKGSVSKPLARARADSSGSLRKGMSNGCLQASSKLVFAGDQVFVIQIPSFDNNMNSNGRYFSIAFAKRD